MARYIVTARVTRTYDIAIDDADSARDALDQAETELDLGISAMEPTNTEWDTDDWDVDRQADGDDGPQARPTQGFV